MTGVQTCALPISFAPDIPLTAAMAMVLVAIALIGQLLVGRLNKEASSSAAR